MVLAIIGGLSTSDDETGESNPAAMSASVHVLPGGVIIINDNDFRWYGLIVTIDDLYSTRYRLGDPNYPFVRPDRITEPGEEYASLLSTHIDKNGKEFEGIVSSGPHHQDSGEAKIRESTAGVSRKPSSDGKARGSSSKHLCGLTAWNT